MAKKNVKKSVKPVPVVAPAPIQTTYPSSGVTPDVGSGFTLRPLPWDHGFVGAPTTPSGVIRSVAAPDAPVAAPAPAQAPEPSLLDNLGKWWKDINATPNAEYSGTGKVGVPGVSTLDKFAEGIGNASKLAMADKLNYEAENQKRADQAAAGGPAMLKAINDIYANDVEGSRRTSALSALAGL